MNSGANFVVCTEIYRWCGTYKRECWHMWGVNGDMGLC